MERDLARRAERRIRLWILEQERDRRKEERRRPVQAGVAGRDQQRPRA